METIRPKTLTPALPTPIRVLGFDPGSKQCGWSLADCTGPRPIYLDGGECAATWEETGDIMSRCAPTMIAIESIVIYGASDDRHTFRMKALAETAYVAGLIHGAARSRALWVTELAARDWRKRLIGSPHSTDARIKSTLQVLVANLPKRTNEHVRDALGLAIAAGFQERDRRIKSARMAPQGGPL